MINYLPVGKKEDPGREKYLPKHCKTREWLK